MSARFETFIEAALVDDTTIEGLVTPGRWVAVLASLYLRAGLYMPADAKERGASFGFCDENGAQVPRTDATHFGWTATRAPGWTP